MSSAPQPDWYLGSSSYYQPIVEGGDYVDDPAVLEMNNQFVSSHSHPPYSYFPASGYLNPIQESSTQNVPASSSGVNQQIEALRQAVAVLEKVVCERLDKLEQAASATQNYINKFAPWSMEVHNSYTQLLEAVSERQSAPRPEHADASTTNTQDNKEDKPVYSNN